jgi:hypothetical protein
MKKRLSGLLSSLIFLLAVGCQSSDIAPVQAVESYLSALTNKDQDALITLSCKEWEDQSLLEYDAFGNVTTELVDLKCSLAGSTTNDQGETINLVNCTGSISASYNGEMRTFDLSKRIYKVVNRSGSVQICGY